METDPARTFGELLRRYRTAAGLTQEGLAERTGLTPQGISLLERGERQHPQPYTVQQLAEALVLTAEERGRFAAAAKRRDEHRAPRSGGDRDRAGPPLVGRTHELALLERHLQGDGARVLLLAGEPGIGKTRLLREAAERAVRGGWTVLAGGCQRRGGQDPYAPLLEALQHYLRMLPPAQWRLGLQGCAWLVRLLPELGAGPIEPLPAWTLTPDQERRLMFGAVERFVTNVAGPGGTLLVLDDLQWAGRDALDLLATLVRSAPGVPIRVICAYRDTETPPDLTTLLADLAHGGLATHHLLTPLRSEEVEQLLASLLAGIGHSQGVPRERVVQRTGGVPFFVVSCAQALRLAEGEVLAADAVPWDVTQSVRQRVAALPETTQALLGAAAVVGRAVQPRLLTVVTARPEEEVLTALADAHRVRLFEEEADGYCFAHDVVREVVEADLGRARRLVLHRRVAEGIEALHGVQTGAACDVLAFHYSRSDTPEHAVAYLVRAGQSAAERYATAQALGYFQQALDLSRDREAQEGILAQRARVLVATYQGSAAAGDYERLLAGARQRGNQGQELEALLGLSRAYYIMALDETAGDAALRCRGVCDAAYILARRLEDKRGMVRALVATGWLNIWPDFHDQVVANAREALALSEEIGDDDLILESRLIMWRFLPHEEAAAWGDELLRQCIARHDLLQLNEMNFLLMWGHLIWGNFERSVVYCDAGISVAEELGAPPVQYPTLKALALLRLGRFGAAWEALQQEVTDDAHPFGRAWRDMGVGLYFFELLAYEKAATMFRSVEDQARRLHRPFLRRWAGGYLALALVRSGRGDEVDLATITQDMALLEATWSADVAAQPMTPLAEFLLSQGRVEEALQQAVGAASYAEQHGLRPEYLWALEVQVRCLLRLGRADAALTLADDAVQIAAEMSSLPLVWRVQAARAEALAALGEAEEATRAYAAAAAVIHALAGTIPDSAPKEGFLASPQVAAVLAASPAEEHAQ